MGPTLQEVTGIPKKPLSRKPFMLMLQDDSGEVTPVKLDASLVNSDSAIIVLDEINDTCWVFVGRNVNMPTRMHALRIGKSVAKSGHSIGITNIGMASTHYVEMLEKDAGDPEVAGAIERFREAITRRWQFEDKFLAFDPGPGPPIASEARPAKPAPMPEPEPAPTVPETPTITATTITEEPEPEPEPEPVVAPPAGAAEQKTAYLIYSAVRNADLVYTERFERDGKMGVKIEAPGIMVIEAVQDGDDLHIDPADFGDSDEASQIKADYESWVGDL
ncbi:MAG: hypothetical protein ACFE9W_10685 [Promethearchaeota archaeon]